MTPKIYLDNNATTALAPSVASLMKRELDAPPSNPSSVHCFGREAKIKLSKARETLASYFKVKPQEIIFTSGGTESMNLLLRGLISPSSHVITSNIEHSCVEKTLLDLQKQGSSISFLPAGPKGFVSLDQVQEAVTEKTRFLVFSATNSETGVKPEIEALASFALKRQLLLLIDGVAQLGKEPPAWYPGIAGAGFSAHKIHGPKGVGFIVLPQASFLQIHPFMTGGGQEFGLRSGTENLTGILGLEEAIKQIETLGSRAFQQMQVLRNLFEQELLSAFPWIQVNGTGERICNVSNLCFPGVDAETLIIQLDIHGIAASQGSACSSGALEPSRILLSMGMTPSMARSSVRFSFSRFNTSEEINQTVAVLKKLLPQLREA